MKPAHYSFRTQNLTNGFRLILIAAVASLLMFTCSPPGGGPTTPQVATPVITPATAATFEQDAPVTITTTTAGATLWYTTDGSDPSAANFAGSGLSPLTIPGGTFAEGAPVTVRAIGTLAGSTDSTIAQAVYTTVQDTMSPVPVISSAYDGIGIVSAPFTVTITFNEDVAGFDETDLVDTNDNFAAGAIAGGPRIYTSLITPDVDADDETIAIDINASAANDTSLGLNASAAAAQFTITYDDDAPLGVITSTSPDPTNATTIRIDIVFNLDVTGFDASDLVVSANAQVDAGSFTVVNATTYWVNLINPVDGTITVDIPYNRCTAAGVPNLPSAQFSIVQDDTPPSASFTPLTGNTSNSNPLAMQIDWDEPVTGFDEADITPSLSNCTIQPASWTPVSASRYTFNLIPSSEAAYGFQIDPGAATDAAGNASTGTFTWSHTYSTAPIVGAPDLESGSDSANNSDNVTSDFTPEFSGTCNEPGTLRILSDVDGQLYSGAITGDWGPIGVTITTYAGQTGVVHNITAEVTDAQSNVVTSSALAVTFDTAAPSMTLNLNNNAADDTGSSTTDHITNNNSPRFIGTSNENGAGVTLVIHDDTDAQDKYNGTVNVAGGAWGPTTVTTAFSTSADQTGTTHTVWATITDLAGNTSSSASLTAPALVIDNVAPTIASAPDLVYTSDTGALDNDNITSDIAPQFNGTTTEDGSLAIMSSVDSQISTTTGVTTGAWGPINTAIATYSGLAGTSHNITAEITDTAGNTGTSSALTAVFDRTAPTLTFNLNNNAADDTGSLQTDHVTNNNSPRFVGTSNESGNGVTLVIHDDTDANDKYNGTVNVASGNWGPTTVTTAFSTSAVLTGTTHTVTATITDLAGNTSSSASLTAPALVIDNTAPTNISTPDMDASTDSGVNNDDITNFQRPAFNGSADEGGTLDIYSGFDSLSHYNGSVSTSWSAVLLTSDLDYTGQTGRGQNIYFTVTDLAGNSASSSTLWVVIDRTAPTVTFNLNPAVADDSGSSQTDHITNVTSPYFLGTSNEDGNGLALVIYDYTDAGNKYNGTVNVAAGTWGATQVTTAFTTVSTLGVTHNVRATIQDVAGNTSAEAQIDNVGTYPLIIDSGLAWKTYGDPTTVSSTVSIDPSTNPNLTMVVTTAGSADTNITTYTTEIYSGSVTFPIATTARVTDTAGNTGDRTNVQKDAAGLATALGGVTSGNTVFIANGTYSRATTYTVANVSCWIVGEGQSAVISVTANTGTMTTGVLAGGAQYYYNFTAGQTFGATYSNRLITKTGNNTGNVRFRNIWISGGSTSDEIRHNNTNAPYYWNRTQAAWYRVNDATYPDAAWVNAGGNWNFNPLGGGASGGPYEPD